MNWGDATAANLVADIGGTHARFAMVEAGKTEPVHARTLRTIDFPGVVDAVEQYLSDLSAPRPSDACMAVACPVGGDDIRLTNNDWAFSVPDVRRCLGLDELIIVNDFKALATAVPHMIDEDLIQIGAGRAVENSPICVLGPGTGLGVASMVFHAGVPVVIEGEGGHIGFAPETEREFEILRILSRQYGRVSTERVLSGQGLYDLHQALAVIDGKSDPGLDAPAIIESANDGSCSRCGETIQVFTAILGSFAGDVALITGSHGGVYLGGGIAPRIRRFLEEGPFRSRFENKGRMSALVKEIPTYLITADNPSLNGAAMLLKHNSN